MVAYLIIGELSLHGLFHQIKLISVPCCRKYHVPLSRLYTVFCRSGRPLPVEKEVALPHDIQHAMSVPHSMGCCWFPFRTSNAGRPCSESLSARTLGVQPHRTCLRWARWRVGRRVHQKGTRISCICIFGRLRMNRG